MVMQVIALIQAVKAGADEALMLDPTGAVATCNATNFFIVTGGAVVTSTGLLQLYMLEAASSSICRGASDLDVQNAESFRRCTRMSFVVADSLDTGLPVLS